MSWPGAAISGFRPKSPIRGPRLEKPLRVSCLVVLATVSAASAAPGAVTDSEPPAFPAATTNNVPELADSRSISVDSTSLPSPGCSPPRLMLTTFAPCCTAQSMPARIEES
jgi:hypothetical protein